MTFFLGLSSCPGGELGTNGCRPPKGRVSYHFVSTCIANIAGMNKKRDIMVMDGDDGNGDDETRGDDTVVVQLYAYWLARGPSETRTPGSLGWSPLAS